MEQKIPPLVYSPVRHRYALAALKIQAPRATILDVGGYKSREQYLAPFFQELNYTSVNVGTAWYHDEESHYSYDGNVIPFRDHAFPYVISVDSLEHIPANQRAKTILEIIRVTEKRAVIVVPISNGGVTDEERFLLYSERFGVEPMPSLAEHVKYGLPTVDDLRRYVGEYSCKITFASPRHLYWSFQMAMLINTIVTGGESEKLNRRIYEFMEEALRNEDDSLDQCQAYRAILTIDNPN